FRARIDCLADRPSRCTECVEWQRGAPLADLKLDVTFSGASAPVRRRLRPPTRPSRTPGNDREARRSYAAGGAPTGLGTAHLTNSLGDPNHGRQQEEEEREPIRNLAPLNTNVVVRVRAQPPRRSRRGKQLRGA